MNRGLRVVTALGLVALVSARAEAAPLVPVSPNCNAAVALISPPFAQCYGAFSGNSNGPELDDVTDFLNGIAYGGNTFAWASGADVGESSGFLNLTGIGNNQTTGTINFNDPLGGTFVIALKASNQFSLYLFDVLSPITSIQFSTLGTAVNNNGIPQGLSNVGIWTGTGGNDPFCIGQQCVVQVPEPASAVLLLGGLVGLVAVARRRRDA